MTATATVLRVLRVPTVLKVLQVLLVLVISLCVAAHASASDRYALIVSGANGEPPNEIGIGDEQPADADAVSHAGSDAFPRVRPVVVAIDQDPA